NTNQRSHFPQSPQTIEKRRHRRKFRRRRRDKTQHQRKKDCWRTQTSCWNDRAVLFVYALSTSPVDAPNEQYHYLLLRFQGRPSDFLCESHSHCPPNPSSFFASAAWLKTWQKVILLRKLAWAGQIRVRLRRCFLAAPLTHTHSCSRSPMKSSDSQCSRSSSIRRAL
ncbi:unnamed protein product, partial [Phaeothamnion confervicola]